jgi:hypothetical protein
MKKIPSLSKNISQLSRLLRARRGMAYRIRPGSGPRAASNSMAKLPALGVSLAARDF